MNLVPTPGQTVGPFFGFALPYDGSAELVPSDHTGAIRLHGRVLDGTDEPVPDALLELWQPDSYGAIAHLSGQRHRNTGTFAGWGRAATDDTGRFGFTTVTPGPSVRGTAAYFALTVFARGLLDRLFTRAYLPISESLQDSDPLLGSLARDRRATLIATPDEAGYRFDIRLQGVDETVFLTYPRH